MPACPCSRCAAPESPSSWPTAGKGLLADGDGAMAAALVEISANTELRRTIAEHNRTSHPPTAWPTVLDRVNDEYARAVTIRAAVA